MAPAILGLPPVILSLVTPGYYRDEMQRLWMVVSLRFTPDHPTHNMPRACISVSLWQRLPLELYCGTDQMYWIMAAHVQIGDLEQLDLKLGIPMRDGSSSGP
ncbi:protein TCL1B2-like isoform X3 [Mesocricetus auratus]|uniref:Protein TCL1B2-like isoform X3 n=1 Tax=Mesocricetus auratus TaxID=10036 RepID=A0ABM2XCC4_MESAU|nr:protein TCL1B2-like isoform X3 [Mesocricetus auratus]